MQVSPELMNTELDANILADDVHKFLLQCLPRAVSVIQSDNQQNRLRLIKKLLSHTQGISFIVDTFPSLCWLILPVEWKVVIIFIMS